MARKTTNRITLDADFVLDDLIWWGMRYISHRSTYATSAAMDYANLIVNHRHKFDRDRLLFFARDVRSEICDRLRFSDNIKIENYSNDRIERDAYSLIKEEMMRQSIPWTDSHKYRYEVDCMECTCEIIPLDKCEWNEYRALHNDIDVNNFVILADVIDRVFEVRTKYEGRESLSECVESINWYQPIGEDKPRWCREYKPIDNLHSFISRNYITKIERKKYDYQ